MNILVTGANGFVGKNLITSLEQVDSYTILTVTRETPSEEVERLLKTADFIFHLAGVNRPTDSEEFNLGNVDFTQTLLNTLRAINSRAPIVFSSSIQARNQSPYGLSKREAENLVFDYSKETGVKVYVYRLPNLFGKWSKPNYNSVIATFCHNISHHLPIQINTPNTELTLVYIDDLLSEFMNALQGKPT